MHTLLYYAISVCLEGNELKWIQNKNLKWSRSKIVLSHVLFVQVLCQYYSWAISTPRSSSPWGDWRKDCGKQQRGSQHQFLVGLHLFSLLLSRIMSSGSVQSQKKKNQMKSDINLTVILFVTVFLFLVFNIPRVIISIYEALTIQNLLRCSKKRLGYYKIWYLYVQATLQLLQVC